MPDSPGKSSDFADTDPWEGTEELPHLDPSPGTGSPPPDLEDPWDDVEDPWSEPVESWSKDEIDVVQAEVVTTPGRSPHRLSIRPSELIRSHRFAILVAVGFVVAAILMLSSRPPHAAHSRRPANAYPTRVGPRHR